jgi:hypothetical protein
MDMDCTKMLHKGTLLSAPAKSEKPEIVPIPEKNYYLMDSPLGSGILIALLTEKRGWKAVKSAHPEAVLFFGHEIDILFSALERHEAANRPKSEFDAFLLDVIRVKKEFAGWVVPPPAGPEGDYPLECLGRPSFGNMGAAVGALLEEADAKKKKRRKKADRPKDGLLF